MIPQLNQVTPANVQENQHSPKTVHFNGKSIELLSGSQCFQTYGCYPGTMLNSEEGSFIVVGMGKQGELWGKTSLTGKVCLLEGIHNQKDLSFNEFDIIQRNKRKREEANIDDSQDIVGRVHKLYKAQSQCDVYFEVEGQIIGAHAAILMEGSDYFRSLLEGKFKEGKSQVIRLKDCTKEEFDIFMHYLYSGRININKENVLWIAEIANYFNAEKLQEHCKTILIQFLNPTTTLSYLEAIAGKDHCLASLIIKVFYQQFKEIGKQDSDTIEELDRQTLFYIIQQCPADLQTELVDFVLIWLLSKNDQLIARAQFLNEIFFLCKENNHLLQKYAKQLCKKIEEIPSIQREFEILARTSQSNKIKVIYAKTLSHFHQPAKAKIYLESVLEIEPHNLFALANYGDTLRQLGQLGAAKAKLEEALALEPQNPFALKSYAEVLRMMRQLDAAKAKFEEFLALHPLDIFSLSSYADTLRMLEQFDAAKAKCEETLVFQPHNPFVLRCYAETLRSMGYLDAAKTKFEEALALEPRNAFALRGYGDTLREMGYLDTAKLKLEEALALKPQGITILSSYGEILRDMNQLHAARAQFEKALYLLTLHKNVVNTTGNAITLSGYAETLRLLGELSSAKTKFEEALVLKPNHPFALRGYAETLRSMGYLDAAKTKFEEALALEPNHLFALKGYADTLLQLNQLDAAKVKYEELLTLDPYNSFALSNYKETLRQIEQLNTVEVNGEKLLEPATPPYDDALISDLENDHETPIFDLTDVTFCDEITSDFYDDSLNFFELRSE